MDVRLPDGTIIRGVPDGTTREQIAQKLQASGRQVPQEWLDRPGPSNTISLSDGRTLTRDQAQAELDRYNASNKPPSWKDRLFSADAGLAQGVAGVAGLPVDTAANLLDLGKAGIGYAYSKITGKSVPQALTVNEDRSGIIGSSQNIVSGLNRLGIRTEPTRPDDPASAGLHAAGGVIAPMLLPGQKQPATAAARIPANAQRVIAAGEKHGVPVFYDDVTQSAVAKKIGVAAEPLGPLGTGSGRAAQADAAKSAAESVTGKLAVNIADDVPIALQKGLNRKLSQFQTAATNLYNRAASQLDPAGNIPVPSMDAAISQQLAKQASLGSRSNQAIVDLLQKYQQAPRGNFSLMREMRSDIGTDIADFYNGANKTIGEKGVGALQAMKNGLDADMSAFAKAQGGNAEKAWRAADGFYRANIVPFKEAGFRDLAKTAEPEKAWRYLLASGSIKSRAVRMYNSLDESGRSAVRYGLVKDAMDMAKNEKGVFSPAKFAKYLEDHEAAVNTFFRGSELQEIKGFQNLMRHVERAGQFAENPPTGQRIIPYLFAAGLYADVVTATAIGSAGVGTRLLFQTKTGRNLLLQAAARKPGSREAQIVADKIAKYLAVASSGTGASGSDQQGTSQQVVPQAQPSGY